MGRLTSVGKMGGDVILHGVAGHALPRVRRAGGHDGGGFRQFAVAGMVKSDEAVCVSWSNTDAAASNPDRKELP
jgi:hypothetical protein